MKKIVFLLAAVTLFAASCDKNDDGKTPGPVEVENGNYVGTVTVENVGAPDFTMDNVTVKVTFGDDGKAEIKMELVKFAEMMPKMDITIPGATAVQTNDGVNLTGEGIVPTAMGGPFPAYTITGLTGSVTPSALSFSMMCGAFPTSFTGTKAE